MQNFRPIKYVIEGLTLTFADPERKKPELNPLERFAGFADDGQSNSDGTSKINAKINNKIIHR